MLVKNTNNTIFKKVESDRKGRKDREKAEFFC
jgi:hypothetical protein